MDSFSQLMEILHKSKPGQSDVLINKILELKPDVNKKDTTGYTPLTLALKKKISPQIINTILDLKPNINAEIFIFALKNSTPEIINKLKKIYIVDEIIKKDEYWTFIIKYVDDTFNLNMINNYDYFLINNFEDFKKVVYSGKLNIEILKKLYYFNYFPLYTKNELIKEQIVNEFNIDIMVLKAFDTTLKHQFGKKTKSWINNYTGGAFMGKKILIHHVDTNIEQDLKKTIKKESYTLYRGYTFEDKKNFSRWFNENLNINQLNKNDKFKRNFDYYSAWSECIKVSYRFALGDAEKYGVVLKMKISKKNVFVDFNNTEFNKECEILIKPGIYAVEVYDIIHNKESINSSNLLSKEISIDNESENESGTKSETESENESESETESDNSEKIWLRF